jgi:catechol 1,2-dioxygenase
MDNLSRRDFLRRGSFGLAATGAGIISLKADIKPTAQSGELGDYGDYMKAKGTPQVNKQEKLAVTEDNILGPFYRKGAPYRAKVTPPLEPGTVLLITGHVWGFDTKKPLANTTIDVWQANADGRYDNDDPKNPPAKGVFKNRARLITDENGYYEYETIHPGRYKIGKDTWRPSHIHYMVQCTGYKSLVTQLYFKGDPHNKTDDFIKESLIIEVQEQKVVKSSYELGTFDIVLAPK